MISDQTAGNILKRHGIRRTFGRDDGGGRRPLGIGYPFASPHARRSEAAFPVPLRVHTVAAMVRSGIGVAGCPRASRHLGNSLDRQASSPPNFLRRLTSGGRPPPPPSSPTFAASPIPFLHGPAGKPSASSGVAGIMG